MPNIASDTIFEVKEVYYDGYFYDVSKWIPKHPGGRVIEFYTEEEENATCAMNQFHNRSMKRMKIILKSLKRRAATPEEKLNLKAGEKYHLLNEDFEKLHKELEEEGCFEPNIPHVVYRLTEMAVYKLLTFYFLTFNTTLGNTLFVFFGTCFATRCAWVGHEGGHHSLTGHPKIDQLIHSFTYGYGIGLSSIWWRDEHSRHHAMPQRVHHDFDLETLPFVAFSTKVLSEKESKQGSNFLIRHQSKLFVLIDTLLGTFIWKLYLGPRHAFKRGAYLDLFFMFCHYALMLPFTGIRLYLIVNWFTSIALLLNLALSHTHFPAIDKPLHWVEYSLAYTTDIEPSWWCDWWMGYLNYQVEHHLFPTMPQFRQRDVIGKVKALAKKHNLPYNTISYTEAVKRTFQNLENVSQELRKIH